MTHFEIDSIPPVHSNLLENSRSEKDRRLEGLVGLVGPKIVGLTSLR